MEKSGSKRENKSMLEKDEIKSTQQQIKEQNGWEPCIPLATERVTSSVR